MNKLLLGALATIGLGAATAGIVVVAGVVHLLRDGAVGQHLPERVDRAPMHDRQARLGVGLADRLTHGPVLQTPWRRLR